MCFIAKHESLIHMWPQTFSPAQKYIAVSRFLAAIEWMYFPFNSLNSLNWSTSNSSVTSSDAELILLCGRFPPGARPQRPYIHPHRVKRRTCLDRPLRRQLHRNSRAAFPHNINHNLLGKDAAKFWGHWFKPQPILRERVLTWGTVNNFHSASMLNVTDDGSDAAKEQKAAANVKI